MTPIAAITWNTCLESIRKLELVLFLVLGSLMIFAICFLTSNEKAVGIIIKFMGEQEFVNVYSPEGLQETDDLIRANILSYLKASGMFFNEIFTLIIAFALTLFMIPHEIATGAIQYILPKPVQRYQYLIGKFLGVFLIVAFCWLIMGLELFLFFTFKEGAVDPYLLTAIFLLPLKYAIFIAFMVALTLRMPVIVAGMISLIFFLGGHASSKLQDFFLDPELMLEGVMRYVAMVTYYITPHLYPVFSGTLLDKNENVLETWAQVGSWAAYAVLYTVILLIIAIISFRRKSL
ncbi:ABC transporter permease subunit [bacterium]|nr:ABC transporter permease subunit [bacterium]MBU1024437.1 ABC transporter permease subunit [bacterium]